MRIDVVGKHMTVTDAIRAHAEEKANKLLKFFDGGVQLITFRLEEGEHRKGFKVEVVVDVIKHEDFMAHASADDLYAALDQAVDKATRQLTDFKEKLRMGKRGATPGGGV